MPKGLLWTRARCLQAPQAESALAEGIKAQGPPTYVTKGCFNQYFALRWWLCVIDIRHRRS